MHNRAPGSLSRTCTSAEGIASCSSTGQSLRGMILKAYFPLDPHLPQIQQRWTDILPFFKKKILLILVYFLFVCCAQSLLETPWTVTCQAPLSMGFPRQEYWVAISYSRGSSQPRNLTCISCISCIGRQILYHWATWEAPWKDILKCSLGFVPGERQSRGFLSPLSWWSMCLVSVWFSLTRSSCWRHFLVVALSPPTLLASPLLAILTRPLSSHCKTRSLCSLHRSFRFLLPTLVSSFLTFPVGTTDVWWKENVYCFVVSVEVIRCVLGISAREAWHSSLLSTAGLFSVSTNLLLFPKWVRLCPLLDSTFKW